MASVLVGLGIAVISWALGWFLGVKCGWAGGVQAGYKAGLEAPANERLAAKFGALAQAVKRGER